jgi:glycosyltransferase involved in cell wall biosynthesis
MHLLMVSGDASVATGRDSAFARMLARFRQHWSRIDILTPHAAGARGPVWLADNVCIHPSPWPRWRQPQFIRQRGRELLTERPCDLITSHDFGFHYNAMGSHQLARRFHVPIVSEILHVEGYPIATSARDHAYRLVADRYVRWAKDHVAAFRVMNRIEVPEYLRQRGVRDEQILYLPALYLDHAVFQPAPAIEKRHDIVFVGRLAPNKGLFQILDAVALVRERHPSVSLAILGEGPLRARLKAHVARLGLAHNVTWIGHLPRQTDVAALYHHSRMLVCASTAEGGPRVTVEAMACGVPVISTPVGVMAELLTDGQNGLVYRWQTDALAAHILRLLEDEDLRQRLGAAGRESVQGMQAEAVIDGYARGYHDLIRRLRAE